MRSSWGAGSRTSRGTAPGDQETEDMIAHPAETYAKTLEFLGLYEWGLEDFPRYNQKKYASIDPGTRAGLERRYAEPNARLVELFGEGLTWPTQTEAAS